MIALSYTTMNELISEPHTWVCKQMGLSKFSMGYFEDGKKIHSIVQRSVNGIEPHEKLTKLPYFSHVEKKEKDEDMHVEKTINSQYKFHGYVDMFDETRREFGDIKSGSLWTLQSAYNAMQFRLYSWALDYKDFVLVNLPRDISTWNDDNVRVLSLSFNNRDQNESICLSYCLKAIDIIENINDHLPSDPLEKRSPHCFYINCPWCNHEHY